MARASASTIVPAQAPLPISWGSSPSASSCLLAEICSAEKPIFSDSASATTPRITGQRRIECFFSQDVSGEAVTSISPSGVRTATAQVETPRIITPSSTACPPTGASFDAIRRPSGRRVALKVPRRRALGRGAAAVAALGHAPLEALDATARVDELLPARVERVAVGADLDVDVALGRARGELVAAR